MNGYSVSFGTQFENMVRGDMNANGVKVPDDLGVLIEEQICSRIPASMCWKQLGDNVKSVIHTFASIGDRVANVIGVNPQFKKKTSKCGGGCDKRRKMLNRIG